MTCKNVIRAAMALLLMTAGSAFAQHDERPENRGNAAPPQFEQQRRGDEHAVPEERHDNFAHAEERRDDRHEERHGAGPRHDIYEGKRLPNEYRGRQAIVSDWRARHLDIPPRGYHWVRIGDDYALVAIRTGVIKRIVFAGH